MFELSKYIVVVIYFLVFYLNFFCIHILTPLVRPFYHLLIFDVGPRPARPLQKVGFIEELSSRFLNSI